MSTPATTEVEISFLVFKKPCAAGTFFKVWFWVEFLIFLSACWSIFSMRVYLNSVYGIKGLICFVVALLPLPILGMQCFQGLMIALKHPNMIADGELRTKFEKYMKTRMLSFMLVIVSSLWPFVAAWICSGFHMAVLIAAIVSIIITLVIGIIFYYLLPSANTGALEQAADILCGGGSTNAKEPMAQPSDFAPH